MHSNLALSSYRGTIPRSVPPDNPLPTDHHDTKLCLSLGKLGKVYGTNTLRNYGRYRRIPVPPTGEFGDVL